MKSQSKSHPKFTNHALEAAFLKAGLAPIDVAWFEHTHHRKFAPLPDCKLRHLAAKAGFHSSAEFLAHEQKVSHV
jgi:hypothetical protein